MSCLESYPQCALRTANSPNGEQSPCSSGLPQRSHVTLITLISVTSPFSLMLSLNGCGYWNRTNLDRLMRPISSSRTLTREIVPGFLCQGLLYTSTSGYVPCRVFPCTAIMLEFAPTIETCPLQKTLHPSSKRMGE